jgi:hypothetical protein
MLPFLAPFLARAVATPLVARAAGLPWLRILPVVAVLGFIGYREMHHLLEHRRARAAIAAATARGAADQVARLKAEAVALGYQNNRDALAADLRQQNEAIGQFAEKAKVEQAEAVLAAVRRLELGRAAADLLRQPETIVPPGHEPMNAWLVERVGGHP